MLIDPKLQSDFNSILFSSDPAGFQTAKSRMVEDIQSAMLSVDADPDAQGSLELLLAVVNGWTYAGPDETTPPGPPSPEMMEALRAAADFVIVDMFEIFDEIRRADSELRQMMQAQEALVQTQALATGLKKFETEKQEAQSRYSQAITEAATQIAGGGLGLLGAIGGAVFAVKAARSRAQATEQGAHVRTVESKVRHEEDELKGLVADTKRLRAEKNDLKDDDFPTPKDASNKRKELQAQIEVSDKQAEILRSKITKHQDELGELRALKEKFDGDSEIFQKISQTLDKFSNAFPGIFTPSGRAAGANLSLSADLDRAQAQLYGAFMGVLESEGRSFDSFAQMLRQAMVDAVSQFKEMMMSQAQLAEHVGQTV